jgi:hypothetical protein
MRMLVSQEEGLIFAVYWLACWQYSRVSVAFLAWHELVLEHARLCLNELCRAILPSLPCGAEVSVLTLFSGDWVFPRAEVVGAPHSSGLISQYLKVINSS